ncbi:uncharacterized protein TNCV_3448731 [Trichonephila clavipes]|nr:uncharacterized protein TNCV_3448731 [Trichonephila clavipes]
MRKAVWAVYFHIRSSDEEPLHSFCPVGPNSWCKYQNQGVEDSVGTFRHSNKLPVAVMDAIKPVFNDLSQPKLLQKCLGESRRMWAGVPQGSILSPLLFFIFMNTIHHHIHPDTKITCYADDISVWHSHNDITESEKALNTTLKGIAAWKDNLKLTINGDKTNYCIFSTDRRHRSSFNASIKIQNSQIKKVDLPTYLGTISLEEFLINESILQGSKDLRLSYLIVKSEKNSIWNIPPWSSFSSPSFQKTQQRTPVSNWNCCSHVPKKEDPLTHRPKGLETIEVLSQDNFAIAYTDGSSDRSLSNGGAGMLLLLPDVTEFDCPRIITSTIARFRTEHLKGMKIHSDKTRSYVQCKHCPDLQLTPNHILECPTVGTKLLKMGMVPLRDTLREILYSSDAPRIEEAVIKTFDGI